ncbi:MAG: molybdopterin-dependent oxidoreductase, partial [Pseudomonadota bacterium]
EAMVALKDLMAALESPHLDCRQDGAKLDAKARCSYVFNTTIAGIEEADFCLLIGTNSRFEAPLVNARIRKRWLQGGFTVARIGPPDDLTYPVLELGAGPQTMGEIVDGSHDVCEKLRAAKRPMLIVGQGALARPDGNAILAAARSIAESFGMIEDGWNGFNVLHAAAARVAGLDLGLVPGKGGHDVDGIIKAAGKGDIEVVYLLGADEIDTASLGDAFVIYQGHHGDRGARRADVILPGAAYPEKDGTYVNTEGRAQRAKRAVFPPGDAKDDWRILRALSEVLGHTLSFNTLGEVRARIVEVAPQLAEPGHIEPASWKSFGRQGKLGTVAFVSPIADFYRTDAISRASAVMAECSELHTPSEPATGTYG